MYCRKCGLRLPGDSRFCMACGTPVSVDALDSASAADTAPSHRPSVFELGARDAPPPASLFEAGGWDLASGPPQAPSPVAPLPQRGKGGRIAMGVIAICLGGLWLTGAFLDVLLYQLLNSVGTVLRPDPLSAVFFGAIAMPEGNYGVACTLCGLVYGGSFVLGCVLCIGAGVTGLRGQRVVAASLWSAGLLVLAIIFFLLYGLLWYPAVLGVSPEVGFAQLHLLLPRAVGMLIPAGFLLAYALYGNNRSG